MSINRYISTEVMESSTAIHEPTSRINHLNMDVIKPETQLPSEPSTLPGVPINNNSNVYTTYNNSKNLLYIGTQSVDIPYVAPVVCKPEYKEVFKLFGRKFYSHLVPKEKYPNRICLLKSNDYLPGDFILAYSYLRPGYDDPKPIFTAFTSYIEAYIWLNSLSLDQKVGFEIILTDKKTTIGNQKPHFDADIEFQDDKPDDNKGKFTIEELGTAMLISLPSAIEYVMTQYNVPYNMGQHLLISNSSTNEKQSFHVVIRGFYHVNNLEAKAFYELVKQQLPPYLQPYLDKAVYGPTQQFRLLGNHKLGKNNVKLLDKVHTLWRPDNNDPRGDSEAIRKLIIFEEFLVTYTSGCVELPSFITTSNALKIKKKPSVDLSLYENQIIDLYESSNFKDSGSIRDFNDGVINITNSGKFKCPICNKIHEHENPYMYVYNRSLYWDCRRHEKNHKSIYIGCIDNLIDVVHPVDNDSDDFDDEDNTKTIPGMLMDPDCVQFLQQQGIVLPEQIQQQIQQQIQRVPAHGIIGGVINNDKVTAQVYNENSEPVLPKDVNQLIINIQTPVGSTVSNNEGQMLNPTSTTTIESFLDGNTKYISGSEYNIKDIYDAYERYRDNKGVSYNFRNGQFGKVLTSLGNIIEQKKIKGDKIRVITLKRLAPISNTNPIEALNAIPGKKIATAPALTPEDALNLLNQMKDMPLDTNIPTPVLEPPQQQQNLRFMNKHVDVRNFFDVYLTRDPEAEADRDNIYLCFIDYCKDNGIVLERFGKVSLINYIKRYILKYDYLGGTGQVLKGWKCKTDKEDINNAMKEKNLRKIWEWNVTPYMIGWHNGKVNERYDKTGTPQWKKIDVHYRNHKHVIPIPELIEMTNAFEKSLPDRVKEIKQRQFEVLFGLNSPLENECRRLILLVKDSLSNNIFTEGSEQHLTLKNRIDELNNEILRIKTEEHQGLQDSIKDDLARLRDEAAWCCAIRSTFGTGKTFQLKPFIEAFPEMKILIVLPRISLTDDYMREMMELGFDLYTDNKFKGKITGNRIIVCFPSLPRVRGEFDLLVLDEYKAIKDLLHTLVKHAKEKDRISGKYKTKELKCYQALCQYVANTKRVYVADALLTNAHVLEISKMRRQSEHFNRRVTVYQNLFQKHRGNIVYTVDNEHLLVHKIIGFLREGKRVVAPTNCKAFAELLRKKVMESDLNVTISLTTSDDKATVPIQELWRDKQLIIYTPTILAGNSYNDPIDVVCGYFTKLSCDMADSMQMLMRSRNNTSREYYICVKSGPGKSPIPSNIKPSEVKKFLMGIKKDDMRKWPEEYRILIDIIEYDYVHDTVKGSDPFFNSYANFMKQGVVADREYLFRMLLYMRDAGFVYGGNIYTMTKDKGEVAVIKEEKKVFMKERAEADLEAKYTCGHLTPTEYCGLSKKSNKTKDDSRRLLKYRIKRTYTVDNVPKWLFKIHKSNSKQYTRIRRYQELNGVTNQNMRYELISKIERDALHIEKPKIVVPNQNEVVTIELQQGTTIYNAPEDIDQFWQERDIRLCENALKILETIGATEFLRPVPRFEIQYNESNTRLKDYIVKKEHELRGLVNDFKIKIENLASKVTNKAFGIKVLMTHSGYAIDNMWILNQHNLIWPYNWDLTDKEELRVLIPEPTITDKATLWTYNVVMSKQGQLPVTPPTKVTPVIIPVPQVRKPARAIVNCEYANLLNLTAKVPVFR